MKNYFRVVQKNLSVIGSISLSPMMTMAVADTFMRAGGHPVIGTYKMPALMPAIVIGFAIPMISFSPIRCVRPDTIQDEKFSFSLF